MNSAILAIPGFLGLPSDWNFLQWNHLIGVDLHAFSWNSLSEWAGEFNQWAGNLKNKSSVLMGYSLGGRLALHALLDRPKQWQAAIIVSSHPGLSDLNERKMRQQRDRQWAERFEKEDWLSLMQAWNGQEVFGQDGFHFSRREQDYDRLQLAKCLSEGSLGHQEDLRQQIENLSLPLLWITGSKDLRYCQIAEALTFAHPLSRREKVEGAGHRIPWAQPEIFSQMTELFLREILK
jgi:2-succinyl-6-hydroxy-2,4-cyclohexadiene-1-carboxylate synthase